MYFQFQKRLRSRKRIIFPALIALAVFWPVSIFAQDANSAEDRVAAFIQTIRDQEALDLDQLLELRSSEALGIIRNAVYAAHGYVFKTRAYSDYFGALPWYKPTQSNVDAVLSDTDKDNIQTVAWAEARLKQDELQEIGDAAFAAPLLPAEKSLLGIWQDQPAISDGWSQTYSFFSNRTVVWRASQYDSLNREPLRIGYWRIEGDTLIVEFYAKLVLSGGLEDSVAGQPTLVWARPGFVMLKPRLSTQVKMSRIQSDAKSPHPFVTLGNAKYWQQRTDPSDYQ